MNTRQSALHAKLYRSKLLCICVLLLMNVILSSSVLASMNDVTVPTSSSIPRVLPDASVIEHLVAHDYLNALPCIVTFLSCNPAWPSLLKTLPVMYYVAWIEYSIEHPPEMLFL